MAEDEKKTEQKAEQKTVTQETSKSTETKKESSDVQLLDQSKEKMAKVEGSHVNFGEASKREKDNKRVELIESKPTNPKEKSSNDE